MIFFFTLLLMRIQVVLIIYDCKFMAFSFVTININGLIEEKKQMWYIFKLVIKKKFEIISLQETHGTVSYIEMWKKLERI